MVEKHEKYRTLYGKEEEYWGLGIEEETYIQFRKPIYVASSILRTAHKPERYSLRYFDNYKPIYQAAIQNLFPDASGFVPVPLFMNSHALTKMDCEWNHKTTYEKNPKPNPLFTGATLFEQLQLWQYEYFRGHHDITFCFDGDTIEFMTQHFYKAKVKDVIKELVGYKKKFIDLLNEFLQKYGLHREKGGCIWPPINPGFVVHYSNSANVSVFNNGTYHLNITLPTILGAKGEILYPDKFREDHRKFIRLVQWMEPFFIAMYDTPDPLAKVNPRQFSCASQRAAISRYIGVGTFDTNQMNEGKKNTLPVTQIAAAQLPTWWYTRYHILSGYQPLEELGLDVNYKKHFQHGCEFRFLDWFSETNLQKAIEEFILLAEVSQHHPLTPEPQISLTWNNCVIGIMQEGKEYCLGQSVLASYEKILGIPLLEHVGKSMKDLYVFIMKALRKRYSRGSLYKKFC